MKIKKFLILCSILMSSVGLFGQYILEWSKTYGGEYPESVNDIQKTEDGGYIVVGESLTAETDLGIFGPGDLYVLKLDMEGNMEWEKKYGGSLTDFAYSVQQTSDSGYIISGETSSDDGDVSDNYGQRDTWVLKLDKDGNLEWEKTYGGSNYDGCRSIKQTFDGGYVLAGGSRSDDGDIGFNNGQADVWILKLDQDGNIEWQKIYGDIRSEGASSVQITNDGGYIISAHKELITGSSDYWIIKLNSEGTIEWQKTYGGSRNDLPDAIRQTNDEGFIVAGCTISQDGDISGGNGEYEFWIIKLDGQGALEWERAYGGSNWENASNIEQTSDGGYIVAGKSYSGDGDVQSNYGFRDAWILKIDEVGSIEWQNNFGGSLHDDISAIKENQDGSFIVAGESSSTDFDVNSINGYADPWIFKLIPSNSVSVKDQIKNFAIGPNPSNGFVNIRLDDSSNLFNVEVFNVKGQLIFSKTQVQSSTQIKNLQSGQYYIKVLSGSNSYVRKIMVN